MAVDTVPGETEGQPLTVCVFVRLCVSVPDKRVKGQWEYFCCVCPPVTKSVETPTGITKAGSTQKVPRKYPKVPLHPIPIPPPPSAILLPLTFNQVGGNQTFFNFLSPLSLNSTSTLFFFHLLFYIITSLSLSRFFTFTTH